MKHKVDIKHIAFGFYFISILIQVAIVYNSTGIQPPDSDYFFHESEALRVLSTGNLYPDGTSPFVVAPGYINLLAVFLFVFGRIKSILYLNILLGMLCTLSIYKLAQNFLNQTSAYISLIFFSLYINNWGFNLYLNTDIPYLALGYFILLLYISYDNPWLLFLAGIILAIANWIRPFLPVFTITLFAVAFFLKEYKWYKSILYIFSGLILGLLIIGSIHKITFGQFLFQSTSGGWNLYMSANDLADGTCSGTVFEAACKIFPENQDMTYKEKDKYMFNVALDWIKKNPIKYLSFLPRKIIKLYAIDATGISILAGEYSSGYDGNIYKFLKKFPNYELYEWLIIYNQSFYIIILLLFIFSSIKLIMHKNRFGMIMLLYFLSYSAYVLIVNVQPRYHAPMIPLFIMFASYSVYLITSPTISNKI